MYHDAEWDSGLQKVELPPRTGHCASPGSRTSQVGQCRGLARAKNIHIRVSGPFRMFVPIQTTGAIDNRHMALCLSIHGMTFCLRLERGF